MTRARKPILRASSLLAAILVLTLAGGSTPAPQPALAATLAPDTFADIAAKYSPAVVNISTQKTFKGGTSRREFFGPGPMPSPRDPFWDFFEKFMPEMPQHRTQRSLGTGLSLIPRA